MLKASPQFHIIQPVPGSPCSAHFNHSFFELAWCEACTPAVLTMQVFGPVPVLGSSLGICILTSLLGILLRKHLGKHLCSHRTPCPGPLGRWGIVCLLPSPAPPSPRPDSAWPPFPVRRSRPSALRSLKFPPSTLERPPHAPPYLLSPIRVPSLPTCSGTWPFITPFPAPSAFPSPKHRFVLFVELGCSSSAPCILQ